MSVYRRGRGASRPNVIPAKMATHTLCWEGEYLGRKKNGKLRAITQDYCDFCLPDITIIYPRRKYLWLRTKGCKFICPDCADKYREEHHNKDWKGTKIFVCATSRKLA